MDFSKIKEWFIPEGKVVSLSIGGKTVWNEYPTVINAPTVIELDTLNGTNGSHTIRVIDNNPDGITKSYRIYKLSTNDFLAEIDRTEEVHDVYTGSFLLEEEDAYVIAVATNGDISERSEVVKVGSCFVEGTPVFMADATYKMIEEVQVGDEVKSYNFKTSTYCKGTVTKVAKAYTTRIAMVAFKKRNSENITIAMAEGHPLYTKDGWHSLTNENGYPTLAVGDEVFCQYGYNRIIDIQVVDTDPTIVYSLGVTVSNGADMFDGVYFAGRIFTTGTHGGGSS